MVALAKELAHRNVGRKDDAPVRPEVAERLAELVCCGVELQALHGLGSFQLAGRHKRLRPRANASNCQGCSRPPSGCKGEPQVRRGCFVAQRRDLAEAHRCHRSDCEPVRVGWPQATHHNLAGRRKQHLVRELRSGRVKANDQHSHHRHAAVVGGQRQREGGAGRGYFCHYGRQHGPGQREAARPRRGRRLREEGHWAGLRYGGSPEGVRAGGPEPVDARAHHGGVSQHFGRQSAPCRRVGVGVGKGVGLVRVRKHLAARQRGDGGLGALLAVLGGL
mmetsp:Transcript_8914/g.34961  ORF Transcript_8914/g.34961 Transcript_8914/m.34961 type:complete len:277 (-) Transcript_8914:1472-2302(-)